MTSLVENVTFNYSSTVNKRMLHQLLKVENENSHWSGCWRFNIFANWPTNLSFQFEWICFHRSEISLRDFAAWRHKKREQWLNTAQKSELRASLKPAWHMNLCFTLAFQFRTRHFSLWLKWLKALHAIFRSNLSYFGMMRKMLQQLHP